MCERRRSLTKEERLAILGPRFVERLKEYEKANPKPFEPRYVFEEEPACTAPCCYRSEMYQ